MRIRTKAAEARPSGRKKGDSDITHRVNSFDVAVKEGKELTVILRLGAVGPGKGVCNTKGCKQRLLGGRKGEIDPYYTATLFSCKIGMQIQGVTPRTLQLVGTC